MKRKVLSFFLTVCLVISLLSICSVNAGASEPVSDVTIAGRIDELCQLLNGKYFNTNQDSSCGKKNSDHGCGNCDTTQTVKAQWFKDMFGTVNSSQFVSSGKSCVGFAWFAEWYIFRANDSDTVFRDKILKGGEFNYQNVKSNAHIGDYFWLGGQHAVIYISCDSTGITVLDCNGSGSYNCLVKKRTISYNQYSKFDISRCYSITNGKTITVPAPTPDTSQKTYTVTFDPKGGYINPSTKSFPAGSLIGDLPTPTRKGYVFLGWSTAKEGSGMIVTPGGLTMSEDMTLYAVWKSQTVYFDANGGSTPQTAKNVTIGSTYGDLPIPTRSGYTFDGWYTSASGGKQITSSTIASGDAYITLYAHWSQIPQQDSGPSSFDSSGTFGQKNPFSWGLDSTTGTLVISGNGQMAGWQNAENRPWAKMRNKVTKVIVKNGAQNLSQYLVARCENMTSISIPESVTEICDA